MKKSRLLAPKNSHLLWLLLVSLAYFFFGWLQAANVGISAVSAGSSSGKDYAVIVLDDQGTASERAGFVIDLWCESDFSGNVEVTNSDNSNAEIYDAHSGGSSVNLTWTENISNGTFDDGSTQVEFWVQGNGEVASATISVQLNDGSGPVGSARTVEVYVVQPTLKEVKFGGDKIMFLKSDDAATPYGSVDDNALWKDDDGDGTPETNYPVAYQKGYTPKYGCIIDMPLGQISPTIEISVTGSVPNSAGNLDFTTDDHSDDEASLSLTEAQGTFPVIACYDLSSGAFTMTWKVKVDGGPETQFATTKHQVYVAKGYNTVLGQPRESLYYLACSDVSGDSGYEIADSVYTKFKSRELTPVDPSKGQPMPKISENFLKFTSGDNNPHILISKVSICGGWSSFLQEVLSVNGINSVVTAVTLNPTYPPDSDFTPEEYVLKSVTITSGTDVEPTRTNTPDDQGHAKTQPTIWHLHAILRVGSRCYDPSYGTGPFDSQDAWEDASFDAIEGTYDGFIQDYTYWMPHNTGILECIFTP